MIFPNILYMKFYVYFFFRTSESQMSKWSDFFGNYVILYLCSLFLVRQVNMLTRKWCTAFGSLRFWSHGNLFFQLMWLKIKLTFFSWEFSWIYVNWGIDSLSSENSVGFWWYSKFICSYTERPAWESPSLRWIRSHHLSEDTRKDAWDLRQTTLLQ